MVGGCLPLVEEKGKGMMISIDLQACTVAGMIQQVGCLQAI